MNEQPTAFALELADDLILEPTGATLAVIDKHLDAAHRRGLEEAAARADRWYMNRNREPRTPGDSIRALAEKPLP